MKTYKLVRELNERRSERTLLQSTLGCNSFIKYNHVSLQYAMTLLQKSNQRIKLGLVGRRLLSKRHVVWMPFSDLADCLILDKAEGKEDVDDELLLE